MSNTALDYRLTQYSKSSGCGCKIAPNILTQIIASTCNFTDPNLLIGNQNNDDAAVYDLDENCLISTTDFFMPVVDDALSFGRIAAANAMSDVYAMGGKPIMALAILGWPVDKLPSTLAKKVLDGARITCNGVSISLAGGHSVDSSEPFFGLSVTGLVSKKNIKRNSTAQPGNLLFITKPIGTGIITAAAKRKLVEQDHLQNAINSMCQINELGYTLGQKNWVTALTDITGFGLLGHSMEMAKGSHCSLQLQYKNIPLLTGVSQYIAQYIFPDMTTKNFQAYESMVSTLSAEQLFTLCDPQTNGGLLVAIDAAYEHEYIELIKSAGLNECFQNLSVNLLPTMNKQYM
jgi:selenide,water dikinase